MTTPQRLAILHVITVLAVIASASTVTVISLSYLGVAKTAIIALGIMLVWLIKVTYDMELDRQTRLAQLRGEVDNSAK